MNQLQGINEKNNEREQAIRELKDWFFELIKNREIKKDPEMSQIILGLAKLLWR